MSQTQLLPTKTDNAGGPAVSAAPETLDRYLNTVEHLPPAPLVATQLLSLFSEEDRDVDRIVELIGLDPSLTAEVLKRCNSAYMGLATPVRDMFEAVFQLGFYEVYCIVVALVGSRSISMLQTEGVLDTEALWQHSVTTAVAAAILARPFHGTEAIAFTAGLLHDLGKLVFASVEGIGYAELMRNAVALKITVAAGETVRFGFNHAEICARLLETWNLPEGVCVAIRQHHSRSNSEGTMPPLSAVVCLANDLAHRVLHEIEDEAAISTLSAESLALLGLTAANIRFLLRETREALQKVEALLNIRG